jgi:hypothetical protein
MGLRMGQNIDRNRSRFRELLNILLHTDIKALKEKIGHDQAERVLLSHLKQVFCLAFEVKFVLTLHFIDIFIQKLA